MTLTLTLTAVLCLAATVAAARADTDQRLSFRDFADTRTHLIQKDRRVRERRCLQPRHVYHRNLWFRGRSGLYAASVANQRRKVRADQRRDGCSSPTRAIRYVFGSHGPDAVKVAYCESRLSVNATNGQYLGLFQMGDYARSTYGHSSTALGQARAAYRYFVASGRDWSPWQCRPWGLAW